MADGGSSRVQETKLSPWIGEEKKERKHNTKHNKKYPQQNIFARCAEKYISFLEGILDVYKIFSVLSFRHSSCSVMEFKKTQETLSEREREPRRDESWTCWVLEIWSLKKKKSFFQHTNVREVRGFGRPSLSSFSSSDTTWDADHMFMMSLMPIAHTAQIHSPLRDSRAWACGAKSPLWA